MLGIQKNAMIVSHRHKFIFFAVPRTGTHAIRAALRPFFGPDDWEQEGLVRRVRRSLPALARIGHGHIALRRARPHLPETVWRAYFKFAVVRNPYDRFVSACAMLNTQNPDYVGNETVWMKRALADMRRGAVNNDAFRRLVLLRTQAGLLVDEDGRLGVDFLGRYENLQHSFAAICQRIGLPAQPLPVMNAATHAPYETYYDDELYRLVTDFYRRDFELLDYAPAAFSRAGSISALRG